MSTVTGLLSVNAAFLQEIKEDNRWCVTHIPARVVTAPEEIVEGLDAVAGTHHRVGDLGCLERPQGQFGIIVVVLDEEDQLLGDHVLSPRVKKKVAP